MREIAIVGAGGHARSLISLLEGKGYPICGVFDDSFDTCLSETISGYPLVGVISDAEKYGTIVLAVGDCRRRGELFMRFRHCILHRPLLHRRASVAVGVRLGAANQIFANAFLNGEVVLGENNIVNSGSVIEHETRVGSHNHISIGAVLGGRVSVGDSCMIGAGAVVIDKITIGSHVTIGANSTVIRDILEPGTYVGTPARKIR